MEWSHNPIDFNELETLLLVDSKSFLINLAPIFIKDTDRILLTLEKAVQAQDCLSVQQAAHMLKGSSASLAMTRLAAQSRKLEQMAKANELAAAATTLTAIQVEYRRVQSLLNEMMETPI